MVLSAAVDRLAQFYVAIGPTDQASPYIPTEYRSTWFLTPQHHAQETLGFASLYIPVALLAHAAATRDPRWKALPPARAPTKSDCALAFLAASSYMMAFYFKLIVPGGWRLAYMLQPCHILTATIAILCLMPGRRANYIFQIYVTLSWSSWVAMAFPDLSDYEHELDMFNYWYEHILIVLIPVLLCRSGRYVFLGSWSFILLGYMVTTLYHCIVLQVACLATEVNIATMASPPDMLAHLGIYYRAAQYVICLTLHHVYNWVIVGTCYILAWVTTSSKQLKVE
ncbi:Aste57867_22898 [Aphanomyces stellatus]|uniref:Aste57867_22898 protein n=1 Tax=Aphanomyces stellatus TaxID=120398 RepID=A0A485LMV8_9STRA|nr:hypothetical protein As57867_022827 [Aphanomyces stellatus]VFT99548.1 Aste57867_22898 [Aphanomyces stellatus]